MGALEGRFLKPLAGRLDILVEGGFLHNSNLGSKKSSYYFLFIQLQLDTTNRTRFTS